MRMTIVLGIACAGLTVLGAVSAYGQINASSHAGKAGEAIDFKGDLRVPSDYQISYQMLGIWKVAKEGNSGSNELHVVYASREAVGAYRRDGRFFAGTVLVKEVFRTAGDIDSVSGATVLAGWFVMLKSSAGRSSEIERTGESWRWAWFDAANSQATVSTGYTTECSAFTCRPDEQSGTTLAALHFWSDGRHGIDVGFGK